MSKRKTQEDRHGCVLLPQNINKHTWFYEERRGLLVVHETMDRDGAHIQTDQFVLPWKKIAPFVARWRARERKKK